MNRKKLKNNTDMAINVAAFEGFLPKSKVLVLHEYMADIDGDMGGFAINDFFDAIIAETPEAARSVKNPDFVIYSDPSPYRDSVLFIEELKEFTNSIVCTNYNAIKTFQKLGRRLGIHNVNYLVAPEGPAKKPTPVRGISCGLCSTAPGVHLALLLGSSQIFYTGASGVKKVNYEFLVNYVEKKDGPLPVNIVRPSRGPVLLAKL